MPSQAAISSQSSKARAAPCSLANRSADDMRRLETAASSADGTEAITPAMLVAIEPVPTMPQRMTGRSDDPAGQTFGTRLATTLLPMAPRTSRRRKIADIDYPSDP